MNLVIKTNKDCCLEQKTKNKKQKLTLLVKIYVVVMLYPKKRWLYLF